MRIRERDSRLSWVTQGVEKLSQSFEDSCWRRKAAWRQSKEGDAARIIKVAQTVAIPMKATMDMRLGECG